MWVNKDKPKPKWLAEPCRYASHAEAKRAGDESYWYSHRYWSKIWRQQPAWADREGIRSVYLEAERRRALGHDVHVDHEIPLRHPLASGLHVAANLRVVTKRLNLKKGNRWFAGMPNEQLTLFDNGYEPWQTTLADASFDPPKTTNPAEAGSLNSMREVTMHTQSPDTLSGTDGE